MKRLLSLVLALTMLLVLSVPAGAADENPGVIGGADGSTFILVTEGRNTGAETAEEREQIVRALGGTPGQTNVLLNGACLAFSDAVPEARNGRTMVPLRATLEAMGARVEYDEDARAAVVTGEKASFTHVIGSDVITLLDGTTVKMDVASYATASNRTMVPVRFFSQVLGYDVFWDNDYKIVFLLDEAAFVKNVDSHFTVLNRYLAGSAKNAASSRNGKEDMTLSGTVKIIDSIRGDRSYPYSARASVLLGKDGLNLTASADLSRVLEMLEGAAGEKLPEAYRAALMKPELELIYSDKLYGKSALLDAMAAGEDGAQTASGAWYVTDAAQSFAGLYASMYAGTKEYTVGSCIYEGMKQGDANSFFASWNDASRLLDVLGVLFDDSTFTRSGSSGTRHIGVAELAELMTALLGTEYTEQDVRDSGVAELSLDITLRADGSMELKCAMAKDVNQEAAFRAEYTLSANSSRVTAKGTVQLRNLCDVTFQLNTNLRTTSEAVKTAPPAGAALVELPAAGRTAA